MMPEIVDRGDPPSKPISEPELKSWEAESGCSLPKEYKAFLLQHNGGVVRPWLFRHDHPEVADEFKNPALLDYLYPWEKVVAQTAHYSGGIPPNHIIVGQDPGFQNLLINLETGEVFCWARNVNDAWGDEFNNKLGYVARGFSSFLEELFENEKIDHPDWKIFSKRGQVIRLEPL